jgi:hypothetical protein
MNQSIKVFLIGEIKAFKRYKKLNQYDKGILYAYELILFMINQNESAGEK